jgi:type I restriction enzyme M protein
LQSIDGRLNGGIPAKDVESLSRCRETFPNLRGQLFKGFRDGFDTLTVGKDEVRDAVFGDAEFSSCADIMETAFEKWKASVDGSLRAITGTTKPKLLIADISEETLTGFEPVTLVDKHDAYEALLPTGTKRCPTTFTSLCRTDVRLSATSRCS